MLSFYPVTLVFFPITSLWFDMLPPVDSSASTNPEVLLYDFVVTSKLVILSELALLYLFHMLVGKLKFL